MRYIILPLIFLFFVSCNKKEIKSYNDTELQAINDVFDTIIDIDYHYAPYMPLELFARDSFPENVVNEKEIEYNKKLFHYREHLSTLTKILYVEDTLSLIEIDQVPDDILELIGIDVFRSNLEIVKMPKEIQFSILRNNNVQIVPLSNINIEDYSIFGINEDTLRVGVMSLSRVLFDDNFEKGIFLYSLTSSWKSGRVKWAIIRYDPIKESWILQHESIIEIS